MKKPAKKPKPLFRVEFRDSEVWGGPRSLDRPVKRWVTRIVARNGEIVLSTTGQLYSRRIDAVRIARKLARAFKAGRVEIQA